MSLMVKAIFKRDRDWARKSKKRGGTVAVRDRHVLCGVVSNLQKRVRRLEESLREYHNQHGQCDCSMCRRLGGAP